MPFRLVSRSVNVARPVNTNRTIQSDQRENKAGACELFEGAILVEIFTTDLHQPNNVFVVGRNPYSDKVEKQFACPVGDRLVISKDDKNIF